MRSKPTALLRPLAAALLVLPVLPLAAQEALDVLAMLDGESVVGGGAEDGYAQFSANLDPDAGEICYTLIVEDVEMTAAHIHQGKQGTNGAPVFTLEATGEDGDQVCAEIDRKLAKAIVSKPASYYVNVHSAEFPGGALRGQMEE